MLSKLEHFVLGMTALGSEVAAAWEDIHIIYDLARKRLNPDIKFDEVVEALVKLFDMGYTECRLEETIPRQIYHMTTAELLEHYGGRLTEEEINIYPKVIVHAFRATKKGREEEAKDIYDVYYPKK